MIMKKFKEFNESLRDKMTPISEEELRKNKGEQCCSLMKQFLEEQKAAIYYNPILREYYIRLWSYPKGRQAIYACPWCGKEFPKSLISKYFDTLKKEYKTIYIDCLNKYIEYCEDATIEDKEIKLPEEFKSDKWWKKRGL